MSMFPYVNQQVWNATTKNLNNDYNNIFYPKNSLIVYVLETLMYSLRYSY